MFRVMPSNMHLVCPVSPAATAKRLSINGFWTGAKPGPRSASLSSETFVSPRAYGQPAPQQPGLAPVLVL
jgi:hypothetical protein